MKRAELTTPPLHSCSVAQRLRKFVSPCILREHSPFLLPPAPHPSTTSQWDARASSVTELTWVKNKILTGISVAVCFAPVSAHGAGSDHVLGGQELLVSLRCCRRVVAAQGCGRTLPTELKHSRDPGMRSKHLTMPHTGFGVYFLLHFNFLKRIQWQKSHFPS